MAKRHEIQYSRRLDPVMRAVDNVRLKKDLSVVELCADADVASATYYHWMEGAASPKLSLLRPVLNALGLELVVVKKDKQGGT